jgi:hypothetical protein
VDAFIVDSLLCLVSSMVCFIVGSTLQIILDLCIPEKELAKTCSQISFK